MKKCFLAKILSGIILMLLSMSLFAQAGEIEPGRKTRRDHCLVYVYPHVINSRDSLTDGSHGEHLKLDGDTVLVWVDLEPRMKFTHETLYILISKQGVRIIKGGWWPILNGKQILYGEQGKYAFLSPFSTTNYSYKNINVHIYPHELYPFDSLVDGPEGKTFKIVDNTLLIWVDLLPMARFTHPTAYILISKEYTRVEKGGWWPVLNGRRILVGDLNSLGVISPFTLLSEHIDR